MQSAAGKALALLLLALASSLTSAADTRNLLHARRGAPFRTRAPQKPTGSSYPTVDGCMDYAEWGMGRYWCKKSYSFATCGSRRFRSRRCTVSAPVCEEDQCGTGYKWNPVTGLCDCDQGYGMIMDPDYITYKKDRPRSSMYCGETLISGYYVADRNAQRTSTGVVPEAVRRLGSKCTKSYWQKVVRGYGYRFKDHGYYKGHAAYKRGFYPVPKDGQACKPCPEDTGSSGGPAGSTWCIPGGGGTPPPPPPPLPSPPPPPPPPPPVPCDPAGNATECPQDLPVCLESGVCAPESCVELGAASCIDSTTSPPTVRACNNVTRSCETSCSNSDQCASPTKCVANRCQLDPNDGNLTTCTGPTDDNCSGSEPLCFGSNGNIAGTGATGKCGPCWLASDANAACRALTGATATDECAADGFCGTP